jgi:Tol biopolymer transport system component
MTKLPTPTASERCSREVDGMSKFTFGTITMVAVTLVAGSMVAAKPWNEWSVPRSVEALQGSSSQLNTAFNDGCPIISPHDGSLYMASNRPGGWGGLDIWIAPPRGDGWGTPVNAGPTINTDADELCPSPADGNRLFFVRRLSATDTDIYVVTGSPTGWGTPKRLPQGANAVNSQWEEWSPSVHQTDQGDEVLYFSSTRGGHPVHDIYYSVNLGPAQLAPGGANSEASDARPQVSRNGLELVWDSTRPGSLGAADIWSATRNSVDEPWSPAMHFGNGINSPAAESRPSLSSDGTTIVFGSARAGGEGSADIYISTRSKVTRPAK